MGLTIKSVLVLHLMDYLDRIIYAFIKFYMIIITNEEKATKKYKI